GSVIVVSTKGPNGGLWRSTNTGQTFIKISGNIRLFGLPDGDAFDLVGDGGDTQRLYTAISGAGVFTSHDLGATWQAAGGLTFGDGNALANWGGISAQTTLGPPWAVNQTTNIRLAVSAFDS